MFGRRKLNPVVTNNNEIYYAPQMSIRNAKKMVKSFSKDPAIKDALNELKTLQKFRDMSLATASNPNNPMENRDARTQRKKDLREIQRREQELRRILSRYGIYPQKGPSNQIVTQDYFVNMAKKRHFERGEMMDKEWGNNPVENRLMVYESVADGSISEEMGQYLLTTIAYEEAASVVEENKALVKTYLMAIKENDLSMMAACRDEICSRRENIPDLTDLKSDVYTSFENLSDKERLSLRPMHREIVDEEPMDDIEDNYNIDKDERLKAPPKPEFIPTNTEEDKERLLTVLKESVDNDVISYGRGVVISELIRNHLSC